MTAPKIHRVTLPTSRFTWCGREQNWTTLEASTDPDAVTCASCATARVIVDGAIAPAVVRHLIRNLTAASTACGLSAYEVPRRVTNLERATCPACRQAAVR